MKAGLRYVAVKVGIGCGDDDRLSLPPLPPRKRSLFSTPSEHFRGRTTLARLWHGPTRLGKFVILVWNFTILSRRCLWCPSPPI